MGNFFISTIVGCVFLGFEQYTNYQTFDDEMDAAEVFKHSLSALRTSKSATENPLPKKRISFKQKKDSPMLHSSPILRSIKSEQSIETDVLMALKTKRKITLSQRSLDDMSLLYTATTPTIHEESKTNIDDEASIFKAVSEHSYMTEKRSAQPRLSQFFQDELDMKSCSTSSSKSKLQKVLSLPNYCFLCGYGSSGDKPLIHPCECPVQVHATCLVQHVKLHKTLTCAKCKLLYNLSFGRMHPIWKWHCPYDRKWRRCTGHIAAWLFLIGSVILLFLGPIFQVIELSQIASIVMSIFLLILVCWCIFVIIRTGVHSVFLFCQAFCLTNHNIAVGSRLKGSPEDFKTRILYMLTRYKSESIGNLEYL